MMRYIKSKHCGVINLIRVQEEAEVSRAEELSRHLKQEIADLKRREAELGQLSHIEGHIHFLKVTAAKLLDFKTSELD